MTILLFRKNWFFYLKLSEGRIFYQNPYFWPPFPFLFYLTSLCFLFQHNCSFWVESMLLWAPFSNIFVIRIRNVFFTYNSLVKELLSCFSNFAIFQFYPYLSIIWNSSSTKNILFLVYIMLLWKLLKNRFAILIKFEFFMEKLVKIFILNSQVSPSSTTKYYSYIQRCSDIYYALSASINMPIEIDFLYNLFFSI